MNPKPEHAQPDAARLPYSEMSSQQLMAVRVAFELDRAAAKTAAGRAFCDSRLAIIASVLRERASIN